MDAVRQAGATFDETNWATRGGGGGGGGARARGGGGGAAASAAAAGGGGGGGDKGEGGRWSKAEDAKLSAALKKVGPEVDNRWDKIAKEVGTRSKDQCKKRQKQINSAAK